MNDLSPPYSLYISRSCVVLENVISCVNVVSLAWGHVHVVAVVTSQPVEVGVVATVMYVGCWMY